MRVSSILDAKGLDPGLGSARGCAEFAALLLFRHIAGQARSSGVLHLASPDLLSAVIDGTDSGDASSARVSDASDTDVALS